MGESEKRAGIIDFLYRDLSRIDSIFAQLYQGAIREIAATQSVSHSINKSIKLDAKIASGERESLSADSDVIEKRIDPHDQRIIDILSLLNLSPYEDDLSSLNVGQLVLLRGSLIMRNYHFLSKVIPMLPEIMSWQSSTTSPKGKKKTKSEIKPMVDMLKIIPFGLEVELITGNGQSIIGSIKEEYLEDSHNDLLRIYGNYVPGDWYVLGIYSSIDPKLRQSLAVSSMRDSLDDVASVIQELYITGDNAITPIIIFRELSY
ncbi:MAG TPA: hypothetical protein GX693_05540 [Firmicutes bacterium]|nr:hypothetical protein [Bacillota bacterium]